MFYAEIQYGRQKWPENNVWGKSPVDSADILGVKSFIEITLAHSVPEIDTFFWFTQKFKMAAKSGGKQFLPTLASRVCRYPASQKFRQNRSSSLCFRDKRVLRRYSRWLPKVTGNQFGGKLVSKLCRYPLGQKFQ